MWYATNGEICDYVADYHRLVFAADGHIVHNPAAQTVWFEYNGALYEAAPGETKALW